MLIIDNIANLLCWWRRPGNRKHTCLSQCQWYHLLTLYEGAFLRWCQRYRADIRHSSKVQQRARVFSLWRSAAAYCHAVQSITYQTIKWIWRIEYTQSIYNKHSNMSATVFSQKKNSLFQACWVKIERNQAGTLTRISAQSVCLVYVTSANFVERVCTRWTINWSKYFILFPHWPYLLH